MFLQCLSDLAPVRHIGGRPSAKKRRSVTQNHITDTRECLWQCGAYMGEPKVLLKTFSIWLAVHHHQRLLELYASSTHLSPSRKRPTPAPALCV